MNRFVINIRNSISCNVFKKIILTFIRPEPKHIFNIGRSEGLRFLTSKNKTFSEPDQKCRHNFQDA